MPTRDDLIDATADLLWERGYSATSPSMILKRSGAGQGSMYHHFRGKSQLALAAIEQIAGQMRAGVEAVDDPSRPALERLVAYLDMERDPLRGCRIGRLVQDPEVVDDDDLRSAAAAFFAWLHDWVIDVVATGKVAGELPAGIDPQGIAGLVVAAVQGGYVVARARQDPDQYHAAMQGARSALEALAHAA